MNLPEMKVIKRISLFLLLSVFMFGAGSYTALKTEQFFYPNRYGDYAVKDEISYIEAEDGTDGSEINNGETGNIDSGNTDSGNIDNGDTDSGNADYGLRTENKENKDSDKKDSQQASAGSLENVIEAVKEDIPVVTADTVYLVGKVNLADGTIEEEEESVPVKYIGLDRNGLLNELEEYNKNPPLSELKRGFSNIELTAFSKDRIVICKYYGEQEDKQGFYLMVADHFVIVYKEDKKSIYMNTDIMLESLSPELQKEIIAGKYIESEQELYNFLESYSS